MTANEAELARELANCRFLPGTWVKRFARDMAAADGWLLTSRQRGALLLSAWKYRRQIGLTLGPRKTVRLIVSEIERDPECLRHFCLPKYLQQIYQQAMALKALREKEDYCDEP